MVTATEADGTQAGEFGDSHGILSERIDSSACGVPDDDVWIVRVAVTLRDGVAKIRSGHAAHRAADTVAQRLRTTLLAAPPRPDRDELEEPRRPGGLRVVYAKMVMGQGAMHEKLLLPAEPHGVRGGRSIIDLGQGPVMLRSTRSSTARSTRCVASARRRRRPPFITATTRSSSTSPAIPTSISSVSPCSAAPHRRGDKRFTAERAARDGLGGVAGGRDRRDRGLREQPHRLVPRDRRDPQVRRPDRRSDVGRRTGTARRRQRVPRRARRDQPFCRRPRDAAASARTPPPARWPRVRCRC